MMTILLQIERSINRSVKLVQLLFKTGDKLLYYRRVIVY